MFNQPQQPPDAVRDALLEYAVADTQYSIANPAINGPDPYQIRMQQHFYQTLLQTFSLHPHPNEQEKTSLRFIKHELARLRAHLQPGQFRKFWHHPVTSNIRNFLSGNYGTFNYYREQIAAVTKQVVDQHNLDTLSEAMVNAGFKHQLEGPLKRMITENIPSFHLTYADAAHQNANYVLYFEKIPGTPLYYFKQFDIGTTPTVRELLNGHTQTTRVSFPLHRGVDFTATEAASLIKDRAVFKTVDGKGTWLYLDKNNPGAAFPFVKATFDHHSAIDKLPIPAQKKQAVQGALASALETGLSKTITLVINGQAGQYTISAFPRQKKLIVTDKYGSTIDPYQPLKPNPSLKNAQKMAADMEVIESNYLTMGQKQPVPKV